MQHLWCPIRKFSWQSLSAYKFGCMNNMNNWFLQDGKQSRFSVWLEMLLDVFPHVKWDGKRGQNQHKLPKKIVRVGQRQVVPDKPFHQSSSRTVISDTCGRSGEMLNGRGCGRMLCLNNIFVICVTYKHRVQNLEVTDLPSLLLE